MSSDLKYEHYAYLHGRGNPVAIHAAGIACLLARDLWTLSWEDVGKYAFAFSSTSYPSETTTIVIGNYDRVSQPGPWGHEDVELTQISYGHSYRWDHPTEVREIENTVLIPSGTHVYLLPRLTENTTYIFTENEEDKMSRMTRFTPSSKVYDTPDRVLPQPTIHVDKSYAEQGTYLEIEGKRDTDGTTFMSAEAWLDQHSTLELVRALTKARGVEEGELELIESDPWLDEEGRWETTFGPAGDEQVFMVSEDMTEETALQQINVLARIAQRLGNKRRQEEELFAKVDEFRKALKPNAKNFTPTKDLGKQQQDFQVARFKRVTGFVETTLNKDKEEPTQ